MTSSEKGHYFTVYISYFKTKINKNRNILIRAPNSAAHVDRFQFIQKMVFDYNTCIANLVPSTGSFDIH